MTENELATIIMDICFSIHRQLGPGLLESSYEAILAIELGKRQIPYERQVPLPLIWDGMLIKECYRADVIVDGKVILELKSVDKLIAVHKRQVLTYLKVADLRLGLLINFSANLMSEGFFRIVNGILDMQELNIPYPAGTSMNLGSPSSVPGRPPDPGPVPSAGARRP